MNNPDLDSIKSLLENHEKRIARLEQTLIEKNKKDESIKEFLISKQPQTSLDKTLTIGYFLENYTPLPSFGVADIEHGFRQSKETPPSNISDMISKNAAKGFLMESKTKRGTKKSWVLTNSGEKLIEQGFMVKK